MERKIGEIFNYQDNWYQCIENTGYGCIICHFNTHNNICCNNVLNIIGNCLPPYRKDYKSVIFKKLEKVGEPTMLDGKLVQKILTTDRCSCNGCCFKSSGCDKADNDLCCEHEIYVEIKQNKENMELEKGTLVTINGTNKFIGIISSISSGMEINFKALLRIDKNRNILSFNDYITFKYLQGTSISEPSNEEFDIFRLELEYLGITIEEMEGLFDIKITG